MTEKVIFTTVNDEKVFLKITKALASETRLQILKIVKEQDIDITRLAERIDLTEANLSTQIKILQDAGLVNCHYEAGVHGVRKVVKHAVDKVVVEL